ncbi:2494_t:CDS:2 [Entrophospora sp. SA101]|nr:2494_t:CDS:2 [Entrophospora sp. SA101]
MSHQTFLFSPKFSKKPIYDSPTNKYQEFSNAYVYSIMVKTGNGTPNRADSVHEPVCVADHDFPVGSGQKLVPSVYLMIKPNESNDELQTGQLAIFVRRQWSLGMSSHTHMQDLKSLTLDPQYDDVLKTNGEIRPIWVLLVDGGPDENPRHLKNIKTYCQLFRKFDLDYLTVRTHTPGQSKYNPVERGIATLSGKLAGITLPIHHYGTHLNTQGKVINPDLALQNFRYAGEALCNIWHHDLIFGKSVDVWYVEELVNPFENLQFEGTEKEKIEEQKQQKKKQEKGIDSTECFVPWSWIENHCNLCQYSIDIK